MRSMLRLLPCLAALLILLPACAQQPAEPVPQEPHLSLPPDPSTTMTIEIWSDVVCPFCYIGKREFERALAQFEHAEQVQVVWRSFELDPDAPVLAVHRCRDAEHRAP
jgi:protein-disulfide isomerase